jgi:hypothetical protein
MMTRWRNFNRWITMSFARGSGLVCDHEMKYYEASPYAWWVLLIPIAGIAGFAAVGSDGRLRERKEKARR